MNVDKIHWILGVATPANRRLEILDSMAVARPEAARNMTWFLHLLERRAYPDAAPADWDVIFAEFTPQQTDDVSCGVFVIANALAVAMEEQDCGKIDPAQWRRWLATEAIEKGSRDGQHGRDDILPAPHNEQWTTYLGRRG